MTWTRFPVARGNDTRPINAALVKDCVRGNIEHLIGESPAAATCPINNTVWSSVAATYTDASVLIRWPMSMIRPSKHGGPTLRNIDVHLFVSCSNPAETATFRIWGADRFGIPANVAPARYSTVEVTTSVAAGEWKNTTLTVELAQTAETNFGQDADHGFTPYRIIWCGVQAKTTGGATASLSSYFYEERET